MNLNDLNYSLSAYWSFNELDGIRTDYINNIPLYQNGTINSNVGIKKNAANFDGQSFFNAYDGEYCGTSNGFLISTWVFFDNSYVSTSNTYNADNNYIIEKGNYFSISTQSLSNSKKWLIKINDTVISETTWNTARTNTWYHITVGASSGILFCSIKSAYDDVYKSLTYTGQLSTNTDDLIIGRTLKGKIDETAIWSEPSITSIDQFKEIAKEIYQNGKCLVYNSFRKLWEIAIIVNGVTTYDPLIASPNPSRPSSLSDVLTYFYINNTSIAGNNASNNKATIQTINSSSLSLGPLAPGEVSRPIVVRLNAPNAKIIRNIKIGLIDNCGIPFTTQTFGIETRNYYDINLVPSSYFQGISNGNVNSEYNIPIKNISNTISYYVYINVGIPLGFTFNGGTIRLMWFFDWA